MKRLIKRLSITLVFLFVSVWAILFFSPKPDLLQGYSFSQAVYDDHERLLRLSLSQDQKYRLFVPLAEIAPEVVESTLLQEDQYFYWHAGINPISMAKAGWLTYVIKSRRFGASTITMQLARIRFKMNSRTWSGKIWQIFRAMQLEAHYSKKQILEAYLNLAPYGNNIEGVGAASLIYFGKSVKQVSLPEALTLSVIPQNPVKRIPQKNILHASRDKLFERWVRLHPNDIDKKSAMALPLQMQTTHNLPFVAPHFVNSVLRDTSANQQQIVTTLNSQLQTILEKVTHHYLERKKNLGVVNAVVLLVDTRDMGVKAVVGSGNFFDKSIQGQINGTEIKRSPGSTLKPFIYGLALDQGLIHPDTVLKDVPHSFGTYNPENFDYDFMGPIKAKDALILSRNIPAIYLADQLNSPNLYQLLENAEITDLKPESYYGLALVLGGAELSMQELTSLYAMLVNDGVWRPLIMLHDEQTRPGKQLLSPEASYLVLDMLKNTPRPENTSDNGIPVSWKTGTSSGYRDAWSVGTFGPYVLTVWIGNFNNQGNHAFVGKNIAAPLFFELIDAVHAEIRPLPVIEKNPEHLRLTHVDVCKASGMLPTRYCHDTESTWFIPGKSPIKTDTIYREVAINKTTGLRTCHFDNNTRFEIYEFWPTDLLKIFKNAGIARRVPPAYDANCSMTASVGFVPEITSPRVQLSYIIPASGEARVTIPLTAVADGDVREIYWFINETYLAKVKTDQMVLWHGKPGKYVVRVVDDHGRSDARDVVISLA